jgi:hypothetical protein
VDMRHFKIWGDFRHFFAKAIVPAPNSVLRPIRP